MYFYKKLPSRKMNVTESVFGIRNGLPLAGNPEQTFYYISSSCFKKRWFLAIYGNLW